MGFRLYLLLLSSIYSLFAYGFSAGPATRLSILTAEGGDQIYNTFGHSAIRLVDTTQQIDIVFNYGTFDFGAPNFIGNFINGKLDYYLNDESTNNFVMNYIYQNRTLYQQNLSLDTSQINQIVAFLEWNLKKENRVYRYDFLFDNCATRIRDIFEKMDTSYEIQYIHPESHRSFRKLIHRDAGKQVPWLDWGFNFLGKFIIGDQ